MRIKPIFSCFFSLIFIVVSAQKKTVDEVSSEKKYQPNFTVGFDILNFGIAFFGDRQLYQGFVSTALNEKLYLQADAGYEKNTYTKSGYDALAMGPFLKLGGFSMLARDAKNPNNGFYIGGKLAASFYQQEYFSIPVRGFGGSSSSIALPSSNQSSYWVESGVGGRVQLFDTAFYIDANVQPRYLIYTTKQDEVVPMIVPGFGRSSTKFAVGFSWNLAYRF